MTALTLCEPPLPQCSREARLEVTGVHAVVRAAVDRVTRPSATAVRDASFIRSGAPLLERRKGRERKKEESVQTDPGGRVFASAIRLRSRSQRTQRFESAGEFRSVRLVEAGGGSAAKHGCSGGPQTRNPGRAGRGGGTRTVEAHHDGGAGRPDRQERGRTQNPARPTNERGGTRTRKDLALQRRAVHRRHPALPGCADEAVRNSCVRGKER